jgi:uncharacterized OB-fold protein
MGVLDEKFLPPEDMPDFHRPFWAALKAHRLEAQECDSGHLRFIPTEICPRCGSQDWTWRQLSGSGTVYTFTVVHRAPTPAYQADAPYVVAHVELEEGIRVIGNVTGCAPDAVHIGMPVEVAFDDISECWTLYSFTPRDAT